MGLRCLFAFAVIFGLSPPAFAGENIWRRASCSVVRYYVFAKYSAETAEMYARSKGASEAEIEAARRCLVGAPARTIRTAQETN